MSSKKLYQRSKPIIIVTLLILVVVAWMASGMMDTTQRAQSAEATAPKKEVPPFTVAVRVETAKEITRYVVVQGSLRAERSVTIRSEIKGTVAEVLAKKGARLKTGDPIVRLSTDDRQARLAKAKAELAKTVRDFEAATKLGERGFQTSARIAALKADLESAKASLRAMEIEIANLTIRAPFDGILNDRFVETGDLLAVKDKIGTIVDADPIIALADVSQQNIAEIKMGGVAQVMLVGGKSASGKISFISSEASEDTRTFRVEIRIANGDGKIRAGSTVEVRIPVEKVKAHFISPQLLVLGRGQNALGVMTVDDKNVVKFRKVGIVRAGAVGVWISGLPDKVRIIVRGQGFVRAGQSVNVKRLDAANSN